MKLPEFISYCKLKDIIVTHERLDHEWHANVCNKQKLVIENDIYLAAIIYTHFSGEYIILDTALYKGYTFKDEPIHHNGLESIISTFTYHPALNISA